MTTKHYFENDLHNTVFNEDDIEAYWDDSDVELQDAITAVAKYRDVLRRKLLELDGEPLGPDTDFGYSESERVLAIARDEPTVVPFVASSNHLVGLLETEWVESAFQPALRERVGTSGLTDDVIEFHAQFPDIPDADHFNDSGPATVHLFGYDEYTPFVCLLDGDTSTAPYAEYTYTADGVVADYGVTTHSLGSLVHEIELTATGSETGAEWSVKRLHPPDEMEAVVESGTDDLDDLFAGNYRLLGPIHREMERLLDVSLDAARSRLTCSKCGAVQDDEKGLYVLLSDEIPKSENIPMTGTDDPHCTKCLTERAEQSLGLSPRQAQAYIYTHVIGYSVASAATELTKLENDGDTEGDGVDEVPEGSLKSARKRLRDKYREGKRRVAFLDV